MRSLWRLFLLEFLSLVRSRTLLFLILGTLAWMFIAPHILVGDGTSEGARQMIIRYSLGGVATILSIALLASATGSIAHERTSKRLQLTLVRPVHFTFIALGRIAALALTAALILALASLILLARESPSKPCRHVLSPILPSPRAEAEDMYQAYMESPDTPDAVKKAKKDVVLRLLERRAIDHYQTIPTNSAAAWTFKLGEQMAGKSSAPSIRLRFSNTYNTRDDVSGVLTFNHFTGHFNNITQAILEVPLSPTTSDATTNTLTFFNNGHSAVMLRPRADVQVLIPADSFAANLLRAYLELFGILTLLISFGVFLGAGLGRAPALFTALIVLLVSEISPSVIEEYPDELETKRVDRIGLTITRLAADATHPLSSLSPLQHLAADECIETDELARASAMNIVIFPLFFALLSALVMPRKEESNA